MYRKPSRQMTLNDFILPFSGKLNADNRWVQLARIIPWDQIEKDYAFLFPSDRGNVAKPVRMALGSLIIKTKCGYSDRETVQQITENPYLQYFLGLSEYQVNKPFTPVAMVKFRKRFNTERMAKVNELILRAEADQQTANATTDEEEVTTKDHDDDNNNTPGSSSTVEAEEEPIEEPAKPNQGTLILDATCTPADVRFPTDVGLLNEAREKLDKMIDILHQGLGKQEKRPRTYRNIARKRYLALSKQRSRKEKQIRRAVREQLQYVKRNLRIVDQLLDKASKQEQPCGLTPRYMNLLSTILTLLSQQTAMYQTRSHRIQDRIVNLYQPHVRPSVRGKTGAVVEFGAKVAISLENGYSRIEELSWDPFNEATTLIETVERYRQRPGYYPESILVDRIYRNRDNLAYCKEYGIRMSGPKLGRPIANTVIKKAEKQLERQDARERNAVEGKFREGKRKYSLSRIMAELTTFFNYPEQIRHLIYTTNAVEAYHRMVRKFTKTKSIFPTDDSIRKVVFLSDREITKKWTQPSSVNLHNKSDLLLHSKIAA